MRLTLRTLLAYLDDILDPTDAESLGAKLRESDFASGLVHRIRSVAGRLRLSAPAVEGRGLGADANSVAEYLDNTLAADRVPEFEKVCLESDMHLSEVASCHQVLALVLGEPAHVDLNLRNRIHNLPITAPSAEEIGGPSYGEAGVSPGVPKHGGAAPVHHEGRKPEHRVDHPSGQAAAVGNSESGWRGAPTALSANSPNVAAAPVPDYVAAERKRAFPGWLAALVAGFLITAAALVGINGILGGNRSKVDTSQAPDEPATVASPSNEMTPSNTEPAFRAPAINNGPALENSAPQLPVANTPNDSAMDREGALNGNVMVSKDQNSPSKNQADLSESTADSRFSSPQMPIAPPLAATEAPAEVMNGEAANGETTDNRGSEFRVATGAPDSAAPEHREANPATNGAAESVDGARARDAVVAAASAASETLFEKDKDLGRYASEDQILAYWNESDSAWMRMPARSTLVDGIQLRVPTLFRPTVVLTSGIQATLNGRTDVRLESVDEKNSRFVIGFGQAIISSVGEAQKVHLTIDGRPILVSLADAQSQFAVEVQINRLPGADPFGDGDREMVTHIWPTSGSVGISVDDNESQSVGGGNRWTCIAGEVSVASVKAVPRWVTIPDRLEIDRTALHFLASAVGDDRSLTLELSEIVAGERRNERRSVAARALASLGQFDQLVASFGDRLPRNSWSAHYEELLEALARDRQSAVRVRESANKYWANDADRLLRMAIGYSEEDLGKFGAANLVDALSDEPLEARVMAIESLRWITGKTLYFYPNLPPAKRRESTRRWRQLLDSGGIVYAQWPPGKSSS